MNSFTGKIPVVKQTPPPTPSLYWILIGFLLFLFWQVESRQVNSGTEEGSRRPEKGQLFTSTRTRSRGRLEPRLSSSTELRRRNTSQTNKFYFKLNLLYVFCFVKWALNTLHGPKYQTWHTCSCKEHLLKINISLNKLGFQYCFPGLNFTWKDWQL